MEKVKRADLKKAAEELNEVLGLEPAIDTKAPDFEIEENLIEAVTLIEEDDEISDSTMKVLEQIGAFDGSEREEPEKEYEPEEEVEIEEEELEEEEPKEKVEKEPVEEVRQKPMKGKKKLQKKEDSKSDKKQVNEKGNKSNGNKTRNLCLEVVGMIKKGKTRAEIIEKFSQDYSQGTISQVYNFSKIFISIKSKL